MSMQKPTLVVLAAGMGSRYGGLKQLDPVGPGGETILDYSVYDAARSGFGRVVFIIRKDFEEAFREKVGKRAERLLPVDYVYQDIRDLPEPFAAPEGREKPWGTGHAIWACRAVVDAPFAVINADDFYGWGGFKAVAEELTRADAGPDDHALVAYRLANTVSDHGTVSRGVCEVDGNGWLRTVSEHEKIAHNGRDIDCVYEGEVRKLTGNEPVSMNFWGFRPSLFGHLERLFNVFLQEQGQALNSEFYIPFAVDALIREGKARVRVLNTDALWAGVTYQEDRPAVQSFIRILVEAGQYPGKL